MMMDNRQVAAGDNGQIYAVVSRARRGVLLMSYRCISLIVAVVVLLPIQVTAQEPDPASAASPAAIDPCENVEERTPKGVIASQGNYGSGSIPSDTGAAPGDEPPVIRAGFVRKGSGSCEVELYNTSKCFGYSVSYAVQKSDTYGDGFATEFSSTASLAPEARKTRTFRCSENDNIRVVVKSATKRSK